MGLGVLSAVASGIQSAGQLYSGYEQNRSANRTGKEIQAEAEYLSQKRKEETDDVIQKQKMSYIKSGIELTPDSPLLMLADTRKKGYEEASRILARGYNQARNIKRQGRQALIGSASSTVGSGIQGFSNYQTYK